MIGCITGYSKGRMRRKLVLGTLIGLAVVAAGGLTYMQLVKKGFIRYNRYDHRDRGTLRVGDVAPDLTLSTYEGGTVRLSSLWEGKPVLLIFGSCT